MELVFKGDTLEPTTTFELRFDDPVAAENQIGLPAADSPLVIRPELAGRFIWLSRRSGVFAPTEAPRLGASYQFSLRPGLKLATGQPLSPHLQRRIRTPPFSVIGLEPSSFEVTNAPVEPQLQVQFNAEVEAAAAQPYVSFRNGSGRRIPAQVRQAASPDPESYESATWRRRFDQAKAKPSAVAGRFRRHLPGAQTATDFPVANCLAVVPAQPLPVGRDWKLVLAAGLPAKEALLRMEAQYELKIGEVLPFTLLEARAHSSLSAGRRIQLTFSKILAPAVQATNVDQWISVRPAPTNLTFGVSGRRVELAGDFRLGERYAVKVSPELPAAEPASLPADISREVEFVPLRPRLYFPAFSTDQLSAGRRQFELLALNVRGVQLRAKLLDRQTLIHALRGYQSYFKNRREDEVEPFHEVDFNVLPGKTVCQTNFTVEADTDEAKQVLIDWNQILGGRKHGALFLTAQRIQEADHPGTLGAQTLVQLTDLGVVWKASDNGFWIHVFSYTTGQPVAGANVGLLTEENELLAKTTTSPQGIALLSKLPKGAWLMVEKDGDLHALNVANRWENQLPIYNFNLPIAWDPDHPERFKLFLFSDRPVYRPGETLRLKGIVRVLQHGALAIPRDFTAKLQCYSPEQKFLDTNLLFSALGSVEAAVQLPARVHGPFRAELTRTNEAGFTHFFEVQEFQPNAFEVAIRTPPAFAAGERVQLPIRAQYYHGQPLAKANVHWAVGAYDVGFEPEGFADFTFTSDAAYPDLIRASLTLQGETNYSGPQSLVLAPDIPLNPKVPQPRSVDLLVEMTDLNQQTVSQSAHFMVHSSEFYLGLKQVRDVLRAGESVGLDLIAVQPDGSPHTNVVTAQITCQKIEWHSVRVQGAGGVITYRNERESKLISNQPATTRRLQRRGTRWEIAEDTPTTAGPQAPQGGGARFAPAEAGLYLLEARATDSGGRPVVTAITVHVAAKQEVAWNYRNESQIELIPDQTNYLAGQTATVLLKTPLSGQALVTIEREQVLRSFLTNLAGNAPTLQIPLTSADAPNVFVSVLVLRGLEQSPRKMKIPEYRLGYCQLNVERPETRLLASVAPGAKAYRPGDTVTLTVQVQDTTHRPVPDAEVTLYAVDEGILSLTGYETPDPHTVFYAVRPLGVSTGCSLPALLPEDPAQLRFGNKGYLVGDGGGRRAADRLRKNFLACACWQASLRSDAQGRVTASFVAPDSLTRYRVMAVAQTARHEFGSAESAFEINKPLMVEPALPRFANVGDQLTARALVFNQTDQEGQIQVTLELDSKARLAPRLADPASRATVRLLAVPARGSGIVEFPVEFIEPGLAKWTWRARFANASEAEFVDAVESQLSVGYAAPELTEIRLGRAERSVSNLLSRVNPQLLEGRGTVSVRVANSRLAELGEAVAHLLHYPYGCVEQTSSSLLPWIVLKNLRTVLPELQKPPAEIDAVVQDGIHRLLLMQTVSGGLSYWPGNQEPMLWGSAYGGLALVLARQAGYPVPAGNLDRLLAYLGAALRHSADLRFNDELSDRCLALFTLALAGRAEPAYHQLIYEKRHALSLESRALLALALAQTNGPNSMIEALLNPRNSSPSQGELWFGCPARELAIRLMAWCRTHPEDQQVDTLVAELVNQQNEAHWGTTQADAWAIYALTDYAARVEKELPEVSGAISWGANSEPFQLNAKFKTHEVVWSIAPARALAPLALLNPQSRQLYTQVKLEARARASQQPRQDRGFSLQRTYALVADDGSLREFKEPRVGDRVLISLLIEIRQPAHYVAIDDPWPAVIEGLNPEFKSQQTRAGETLATDLLSSFREFRADRALFFGDHLAPGSYTIRYLARVRAAGTATAPAAKIEEMYHPDHFGLSAATTVTSLPMQ